MVASGLAGVGGWLRTLRGDAGVDDANQRGDSALRLVQRIGIVPHRAVCHVLYGEAGREYINDVGAQGLGSAPHRVQFLDAGLASRRLTDTRAAKDVQQRHRLDAAPQRLGRGGVAIRSRKLELVGIIAAKSVQQDSLDLVPLLVGVGEPLVLDHRRRPRSLATLAAAPG